MNDLSDDELMVLYQDGRVEAFEALFDRYRATVFNYAAWMLGNRTGAEDVLQDAFLQIARAAARYQPRGRFRAWLLRIVRNRCLNLLDTESARRRAIEQRREEMQRAQSGRDDPPGKAIREEWHAAIRRAIRELPERQREALVLYAFEEMAYREIGQVLDMPTNTVKTLIHRARASLARAAEECAREE